jgi:mono/diheme cytochrome c family protein
MAAELWNHSGIRIIEGWGDLEITSAGRWAGWTATVVCAGAMLGFVPTLQAATPEPPVPATEAALHWGLLEERCGNCHNSTDWAGSLAFDTLSADQIASDAETWEKVVRRLRGHLMPPPGEPQIEPRQQAAFVQWLESRLDAAGAARADPGYVGLHRLNRTEYRREIGRLLSLDVEVENLLPKDVSSDGFDNVAAALRTSPAFLDQYIAAARSVARMAIGNASAKPSSREYRVDPAIDQSRHIDGLPLGTRGGIQVEHYFPADGDYEFNIREFFFMGAGYVTKIDSRHRVILTIDDQRVFQQEAGGPDDLKYVDQQQAIAADHMQARFNQIRVRVPAGLHRIGVAFVERSYAQSDSPLQPIAMLPEMERYPNIPGFEVSGPFNVSGVGETPSRQRIFVCRPAAQAEEAPCARRILSRLASDAFRRPVSQEDLAAPLQFYTTGAAAGGFESGVESGLTAILASTRFLFRAETSAALSTDAPKALTDIELASRLSFFLWSEGPDQKLIDVASAGRLHEPAVLTAEVRRMLADPRSSTLVTNFAFQWLNVPQIDKIQPDPVMYPTFDPNLRNSLREEIRLFLDSVLRADRSVLDLLRSDATFLNERLAIQYGITNIRGDQFRPVKLANPNRFGLFGKGAVLMGTSYGNRTSPVLRGAFILENIIGTPPTPPPPGVEQFKETEAGHKPQTVRERLEAHRINKSCQACHGVIDPLGFALENYDVTGAWRDRDRDAGEAIDARGELANGTKVGGPAELSRAILAHPDQFVHALTEKLVIYALGRPLRYQDMPTVRGIVRAAAKSDYRFESIVQGIVASDAFRMNRLPSMDSAPTTRTAQLRDN